MLPLEGIKIVDMTRVLAGPYCTMIMADFGAEVIKVEIPGGGDDARGLGPFKNGESTYFMSINRNKESVTINLKSPAGKAVLRELLEQADAVVENFRPGTMEKLGFGYDDIVKYNPRIVYAAMSGYGHTGPYKNRASYDAVVQAMGGIMSLTGHGPGDFIRVGISIGDFAAGLFGAIGLVLALYHKKNTGEGQKVDVAMLDSQVALLENAIARYFITGKAPAPLGNRHSTTTPHNDFMCADGVRVYLVIGNNNLWEKFCRAVDRPEWIADDRFLSNDLRARNVEALYKLLDDLFIAQPSRHWFDLVNAAGVPISFINTIDKVVSNEQVLAREMIIEREHPVAGLMKFADTPIKMSKTRGGYRKPSPNLGADTDSVLKKYLHKSDAEIKTLRDEGAV